MNRGSVLTICLSVALACAGAAETADGDRGRSKPLQLHLDLKDGSRLIGRPIDPESPGVRTNLARFDLTWNRITHACMDGDRWTFHLKNQDRIMGDPAFKRIALDTIIGQIDVPLTQVRHLDVEEQGHLPDKDLVLHYRFERPQDGQEVHDSSGGQNHAVNHGAEPVANGAGGQALEFDGKSSMLEIPGKKMAGLPTWEDYTISIWFMNDGEGPAHRGYGQKIIDKTVMYHDFYLCVRATGALGFFTYEGDGVGLQDDTHDYRDRRWHHAVVVKKGGHGELWIDGELKDSTEDLKTVKSAAPLLIGYSKSPDSFQRRYWSGMLDELRIYERALSDREVARLFAAGR